MMTDPHRLSRAFSCPENAPHQPRRNFLHSTELPQWRNASRSDATQTHSTSSNESKSPLPYGYPTSPISSFHRRQGYNGSFADSSKSVISCYMSQDTDSTDEHSGENQRADWAFADSNEGPGFSRVKPEEFQFCSNLPRSPSSGPQELPTVVTKDDFEFGDIIGEGAFGTVRVCTRKGTTERYAVKIMKKELLETLQMQGYADMEQQIMAGLTTLQHANLVRLYWTFYDSKHLYFVMELLTGGELFSRVRLCSDFSLQDARFYLAELCEALASLHDHCIVHRDLKPENLLLSRDGHLKLIDFGVAKQTPPENDRVLRTFCGTAEYVSPEVLQSDPYGFSVDWWAYGCLIYELLTGTSPFLSSSVAVTYQKILDCDIYWPDDFPPDARNLVEGLLDRNPDTRLGCGPRGADEIRQHAFFERIEWETLDMAPAPITGAADPRFDDPAAFLSAKDMEAERARSRKLLYVRYADASQLTRPKDIARRSAILREMYTELRKLPRRPPLLSTNMLSAMVVPSADTSTSTSARPNSASSSTSTESSPTSPNLTSAEIAANAAALTAPPDPHTHTHTHIQIAA
eukprot:gnl/Trimastix_PCT/4389.p1 GENE.gnl/Trimastix_PCT/4389~~gnl/Trimastix_PCT/4389.p1  ORF type:complete len:575 (-),score=71.48 gnl/Trimastix_PCT/4389:106-1830(-)